MLTVRTFAAELRTQLLAAEASGASSVEINAGQLHRKVGWYPDPQNHRMPVCCDAIYAEQRSGDVVVSAPPKGKGASLTIRYALPR